MVVGLAALGCGGGSSNSQWFDRPEPTVGMLFLSGDPAPDEPMKDDEVLARHRAVEEVTLSGTHAERLGVLDRTGAPALALLPDMVILTGFDTDDHLAELITVGRLARVRYALGIPTGTTMKLQPEFGDLAADSGTLPALLLDLKDVKWRRRSAEFRDIRVSRLTRGTVFSLVSGHITYAAMREAEPADTAALQSAILGEAFEKLAVEVRVPVVELPTSDETTVWAVSLDKRSMVLPAPGGYGISRAHLDRRLRAN
jgi:hypothetical protein